MDIDKRGIVLDKVVDIDWLKALQPQHFDDFIKFVVNRETSKVCVGMLVHKNCQAQMGSDPSKLYGGNLFWDGHIEWESTLNVAHNARAGLVLDEMRVLGDARTVALLEDVFRAWVRMQP